VINQRTIAEKKGTGRTCLTSEKGIAVDLRGLRTTSRGEGKKMKFKEKRKGGKRLLSRLLLHDGMWPPMRCRFKDISA